MDNQEKSLQFESPPSGSRGTVWGPWLTVAFGTVILVADIVVQVVIVIIFAALSLVSTQTLDVTHLEDSFTNVEGLLISISTIATAVFCTGFIVIFVKARGGISIAEYLGLRRLPIKTILTAIGITIGIILLSDLLTTLIGRPLNTETMVKSYQTSVWPALFWVAVIIFAPLFEEALFRGFLFEGLRRSKIGITGTVIITSLVWSLLHVQYGIYEITTIFITGVVFGIVRYRTKSLYSTVAMHMFMNLVATIELAVNV